MGVRVNVNKDFFIENSKIKSGEDGVRGWVGGGVQGECERNIEVFVKMLKKKIFLWGGGGWGQSG